MNEFNKEAWITLVDFEKAFDSVEHASLWHVLKKQKVPDHFVKILKTLYKQQSAHVRIDVESRKFPLERGVKQGDPISALLFIAIMQDLCNEVDKKWQNRNANGRERLLGIDISNETGRTMTNLRFADDVLLLARSPTDMELMLNDFAEQASEYGLKINLGKTKILTQDRNKEVGQQIKVGGAQIEIIAEAETEKYLGRKLSFTNNHEQEVRHRIANAWKSFHINKNVLCNRNYNLKDRIRLFEAAVTQTLLYGCAAWALTKEMKRCLQVERRKMLIYVFRIFRIKEDEVKETWETYMQRSSRKIDEISKQHGMEDWVTQCLRRKWKFAGKTARQTDKRWSNTILRWKPDGGRGRQRGRPKTRWEDDISALAGGDWVEVAKDEQLWEALQEGFITTAFS